MQKWKKTRTTKYKFHISKTLKQKKNKKIFCFICNYFIFFTILLHCSNFLWIINYLNAESITNYKNFNLNNKKFSDLSSKKFDHFPENFDDDSKIMLKNSFNSFQSNFFDNKKNFIHLKNPDDEFNFDLNLFESSQQHQMVPSLGKVIEMEVRDTAKCFSCMSKLYEAVWPALAHIYKKPLNFTDACNGNDLYNAKSLRYSNNLQYNIEEKEWENVPVQHCSTICVGMWEETIIAGVRIRAHIRGCLDDVLQNGFNESIIALFRWMQRDSCRDYRKRELFKLSVDQSDESTIHVCTCYADYCNAANSSSLKKTTYLYFFLWIVFFFLIFFDQKLNFS